MSAPTRVMLVDFRCVIRAGLRTMLGGHAQVEIVAESDDLEDAPDVAARMSADVVVLDPAIAGLSIVRCVVGGGSNVLAITVSDDDSSILAALRAGASGWVRANATETELLDAVVTVGGGSSYLDSAAKMLLLEAFRAPPRRLEADRLASLSRREREVLTLIARGYLPREIGARLALSRKTVDTYRARLMTKLCARHRSELVDIALHGCLLQPSAVPIDRRPRATVPNVRHGCS